MMFQDAWCQLKSVGRAVRQAVFPTQVTGSLSTADVRHVKRDPWKVFRSPKEVVSHQALTSEDKKQILETWEEDAKHLAVAEAEGMGGGEPNRLADVSDAKQRVAKLEQGRPPEHGTR